ncbi:uncharacterized protein LOC111009738 [Momordica charantia]|uniref:Uncharacterized protein LOC111009738 n=1 Tax=Momordica charantia TaxID=3673 RepID=A0A6J1CBM9_MOMCH|nr:uncharacterized protein LOC111009738 [Momordica charantia]
MEIIEVVNCECCGLKEECTQNYISQVKANFAAHWLCGLCSEAVRDEIFRSPSAAGAGGIGIGIQDAVNAHMLFCRKYSKSNPAVKVADGIRQMLRRRSTDLSSSSSSSTSQLAWSSRCRNSLGEVNSQVVHDILAKHSHCSRLLVSNILRFVYLR